MLWAWMMAAWVVSAAVQAQPCAAPPSGLISWWRAENNAADTAGPNDGTLVGSPSFATGQVGQALSLDGVDDYALVGPMTSGWYDFTIEAWLKTTQNTHASQYYADPAIIGTRQTSDESDGGFVLTLRDGKLAWYDEFWFFGQTLQSGAFIADGNWHHVAVTRQGFVIKLYVDGAVSATQTTSFFTSPVISEIVEIGRALGPTPSLLYGGLIDELTIYRRGLSASDIQAIYASGVSGKCAAAFDSCMTPPSDLVAWWRADGNGFDSMGGHNGVLQAGTNSVAGRVGRSLQFSGRGDYLEVGDSPDLRITDIVTITFWARRRQDAALDFILEKGGAWTGGETNYGVSLQNASNARRLEFYFHGGWRGAPGPADFNWHHYAVVAVDGAADPTFYVDGNAYSVSASGGAASVDLYPSTMPLHIGAQVLPCVQDLTYPGSVAIDELCIFHRALSAAEIQAMYYAGEYGMCGEPTVSCEKPVAVTCAPGSGMTRSIVAHAFDPGGNGLTVTWSVDSLPVAADVIPPGSPTAGDTTLTHHFPLGIHTVTAAVDNGQGGTAESTVTQSISTACASVESVAELPGTNTCEPWDFVYLMGLGFDSMNRAVAGWRLHGVWGYYPENPYNVQFYPSWLRRQPEGWLLPIGITPVYYPGGGASNRAERLGIALDGTPWLARTGFCPNESMAEYHANLSSTPSGPGYCMYVTGPYQSYCAQDPVYRIRFGSGSLTPRFLRWHPDVGCNGLYVDNVPVSPNPANVWDADMAIDANAQAHVAYIVGGQLNFHTGVTTVMISNLGWNGRISLGMDAAGRFHLARSGDTRFGGGAGGWRPLSYFSSNDGLSWQETVVESGSLTTGASLALRSSGIPSISYWKYFGSNAQELRLATYDSGSETWSSQALAVVTVAQAGTFNANPETALAFDRFDRPAVFYCDYDNRMFKLAYDPTPLGPSSASADHSAYCFGDYATLTLTAAGGWGDVMRWFAGGCDGTEVGAGNPLTIPAPTQTTTYYGRWENDHGASACASVVVTVLPGGSGDTNCDGLINGEDIASFVEALLIPSAPPRNCAACAADMDYDGDVDDADVALFVTLLLNL